MVIDDTELTEISFGRRLSLPSQEPLLAAFHGEKVIAILEKEIKNTNPKKFLFK